MVLGTRMSPGPSKEMMVIVRNPGVEDRSTASSMESKGGITKVLSFDEQLSLTD